MHKLKSINRRGSLLLITFMLISGAALVIGSLLKLQYNHHKMGHRSFEGNVALYMAESGLHIALDEMNTQVAPFTGTGSFDWTTVSSDIYTLTRSNFSGGGSLTVTVDFSNPLDTTITSRGSFQDISKTIISRAPIGPAEGLNPMFPGAISSLSNISLMNSFQTDSYNNGVYPAPAADRYNGHVFTKGASASLKSGSVVRGKFYYVSGATVATGAPSNGMVYHSLANESTVSNQGGTLATIQSFKAAVVPVHLQMPGSPSSTLTSGTTYGSGHYGGNNNLQNITFSGGYYKISGNMDIKANQNWYVTGNSDIYITGNFTMGNGAEFINYTGGLGGTIHKVRIFIDGDVSFAQGNGINLGNYTPTFFQLFGTGPLESSLHTVDIKNSGNFIGTVYAPNYKINFNAGGEAWGAFTCRTIDPKNGAFLHYDTRLGSVVDGVPPDKYGIYGWRLA